MLVGGLYFESHLLSCAREIYKDHMYKFGPGCKSLRKENYNKLAPK